jgi:Secretory lipase
MLRSRLRRAIPALLVVLGLAAASACTQPPADFYTPAPGVSGTPGTVLKTAPTSLSGVSNVTALAIQYRTRSATNAPIAVTGSVYVPTAAWAGPGPRPIVSVAQGTQGLGDQCAPSKSLVSGINYGLPYVQALLAEGWAVAITDYEGLGMPGTHTYIVADVAARAQIDIVRAAQKVTSLGLAANAPIGFTGYSQGGQAAARAAEIESTYAPELNVAGVVAGGVPSDPEQLGTTLNGGIWFAFLAMAAVGLDAAYPELNLESYLNDTGRQLLEANQNACLADGLLALGFQSIENLTTSNPLTTPAWQARLDQNRLGSVAPQVPVFQYHSVIDEIIPYTQGSTLRDAWCAKGAEVRFMDLFLGEHALGIFQGQTDTINFLNDRFTGVPFQPTCNG